MTDRQTDRCTFRTGMINAYIGRLAQRSLHKNRNDRQTDRSTHVEIRTGKIDEQIGRLAKRHLHSNKNDRMTDRQTDMYNVH